MLEHLLPLHSGYTFRKLAILRQQRVLEWQIAHLSSAKQGRQHGYRAVYHRLAPAPA